MPAPAAAATISDANCGDRKCDGHPDTAHAYDDSPTSDGACVELVWKALESEGQ